MKILIAVLLLPIFAFALSDEENAQLSNELSQSFNTVPLGRTNTGYTEVMPGAEAQYQDNQQMGQFNCGQNSANCRASQEFNKSLKHSDKKKGGVNDPFGM